MIWKFSGLVIWLRFFLQKSVKDFWIENRWRILVEKNAGHMTEIKFLKLFTTLQEVFFTFLPKYGSCSKIWVMFKNMGLVEGRLKPPIWSNMKLNKISSHRRLFKYSNESHSVIYLNLSSKKIRREFNSRRILLDFEIFKSNCDQRSHICNHRSMECFAASRHDAGIWYHVCFRIPRII